MNRAHQLRGVSATSGNRPMIDVVCAYCFRAFGWDPAGPKICLNCGIENMTIPPRPNVPESALMAPVTERAVMPQAAPKMSVPVDAPLSQVDINRPKRGPRAVKSAIRKRKAGR